MSTETRKIAIACFIGGFLCYLAAAFFAPQYAWLGIFAGLAGGYLSYEFREVLGAVPVAFRATSGLGVQLFRLNRNWLNEQAGFVLPVMLLTGLYSTFSIRALPLRLQDCSGVLLILVTHSYLAAFSVISLASLGARVFGRCYWQPFIMESESIAQRAREELEEKGLRPEPVTYSNVAKWLIFGVLVIFPWAPWKGLCFLLRFLCIFFKLIHSHKRVLCAIDGTIGGVLSFLCFHSQSASFAEHALLAVFGGLIGSAWGIVNWELISVRLLKVNAASTPM